jgi:hypothetical protein
MMKNKIIEWLLSGDPAIVYQTRRDLLGQSEKELVPFCSEIARSGWGRRFLSLRDNKTGLWGNGVYSPKWISTTYTLLDLKHLELPSDTKGFTESGELILNWMWQVPQKKKDRYLDLCICGMLLDICCYAGLRTDKLNEIVDHVLEKQFSDGGWNCRWVFDHDHGSLHTTINILEGLKEYFDKGYTHRKMELKQAVNKAHEFILIHRLFRSDRTGKIIDKKMTMMSYPPRWKYDILRCLDYFQSVGLKYDVRMQEALDIIWKKRMADGRWPVQQKYHGLVHFDMEKTGKGSRWNTLRALRVIKRYGYKTT